MERYFRVTPSSVHQMVLTLGANGFNAITGEVISGTSDGYGGFEFDSIPNGTYVFDVEGGTTGRDYDPTDLLIKALAENPL